MVLHISHNDLDGVGCGILVKAAMPGVKTVYTGYDELPGILDNIPAAVSTIIITDLSPTESWVERIAGEKELILIDHHISSSSLAKYPFTYHSIERCATMLTLEKLTLMGYELARYDNFAACINDYDLWLMRRPDSVRMNVLLMLLGLDRFEKRFLSLPYEEFTPEEELIITLEEERKSKYIDRAFKNTLFFTDKHGRSASAVYAEIYTSELGNHIITHSNVDYVVIINAQRKSASLRSRKEVDIVPIAEAQGGGGHKNAAGFAVKSLEATNDMLKEWNIL